ncbi:hypothetical protein [Streptomyces sp. NPDC055140]
MTEGDTEAARVAAAVQRSVRARRQWEVETAIDALLSNPEIRRLRSEIEHEERQAGHELAPSFQGLRDQYDTAVQTGDVDVLSRICPGKHGRWGRVCLLPSGHEATELHWGITAEGWPIAWLGSAPDDV